MTELREDLPNRWSSTTLGDLIDVLRGVTYKKADSSLEPAKGMVPLLRATNINGALNFEDLVYVPRELVKDEQMLRPGDIVVAASSGSAAVVGKAAPLLHEWEGTFGAFCFALRPVSADVARYAAAYLQTTEYRQSASTLAAGVNINNLKRQHIEDMPVRLAPAPEQHRIVEALDSYLSRLDAAQQALERVQANLERYRASVLQAAVEGRLVPTEAQLAREEDRDHEPASVLLERILAERRARWEETELSKMRAKGKEPKNDKWKAKYKEPEAPVTGELPEPPAGWCWASIDQLAASLDQGWSPKCEKHAAAPGTWGVIKTTAVQHLSFLEDENKELPSALAPRPELEIAAEDLLLTRAGPRVRVGVACRVEKVRPNLMICDKVYRIRVPETLVPSAYLEVLLNAPRARARLETLKTGISDSGVNLTQARLKGMPVPLPPRAEHDRIVSEVQRLVSIAEASQAAAEESRQRVQRLQQSILKWAFEGKLVDQDPSDKPASALLDRIRVEREAAAPKKRSRKKKAPK